AARSSRMNLLLRAAGPRRHCAPGLPFAAQRNERDHDVKAARGQPASGALMAARGCYDPAVSRAFIKEAETSGPGCPAPPGCGGGGVPVSRATLEARLPREAVARFAGGALFCANPGCVVAYFDERRAWASRDELLAPAYPKQLGAPLCACFGVTREALEELG